MKISDVLSSLTSTYTDWSQVLVNPKYIRRDQGGSQSISWDTRKKMGILDYPIMASKIVKLVEEKQYSFQISLDGSIVQIYYLYDSKGNDIRSANLAFYSSRIYSPKILPVSEIISNDDALEEPEDENFNLGMPEDGPVHWIRIDYAPDEARGVLHHGCHMHLSTFPESRFIVDRLPTPKQFIEFVIAYYYPEEYKKHRNLNERGMYVDEAKVKSVNSPFISTPDSIICKYLSHFHIPVEVY